MHQSTSTEHQRRNKTRKRKPHRDHRCLDKANKANEQGTHSSRQKIGTS
jgi:hypothetical protein